MWIEPRDEVPRVGTQRSDWDEYRKSTKQTPRKGYNVVWREYLHENDAPIVEVVYDHESCPVTTIYSGLRSAQRALGVDTGTTVVMRGDNVYITPRPQGARALRGQIIDTLYAFADDATTQRSLTVDYGDDTRAAYHAMTYQRTRLGLGQVHLSLRGGLIVLTKDV